MKATKKIVGAACALVAATALAAGSTFAWFTSNGTVNANGLEIKVDTSNAYLIIADSATNLKNEATSISLNSTGNLVKPSAYKKATVTPGTDGGKNTVTVSDADVKWGLTGTDTITNAAAWYTADGTTSDDGALKGDPKPLSSFTGYVEFDSIFVSVSSGSTDVTKINMNCEVVGATEGATGSWDTANGNSAISVLILYKSVGENATTENWNHYELNAENSHAFNPAGGLDIGGVKADEAYANYIEIQVYVYLDGNNSAVTTKNSQSLKGVKLNFTFTDATPSTPEVGG